LQSIYTFDLKKENNTPISSKSIMRLGRAPLCVELFVFGIVCDVDMDYGTPWIPKNHRDHLL
jgi:hypothetical protein